MKCIFTLFFVKYKKTSLPQSFILQKIIAMVCMQSFFSPIDRNGKTFILHYFRSK